MQRLGTGRRAKHIDIQSLWLQEQVHNNIFTIRKVNTLDNVADMLTKFVPRSILDRHAHSVGYRFPAALPSKHQGFEDTAKWYQEERNNQRKQAYQWQDEQAQAAPAEEDENDDDLGDTLALLTQAE